MRMIRARSLTLTVSCLALANATAQKSWSAPHALGETVVHAKAASHAQRQTLRLVRNGDRIELTSVQDGVQQTQVLAPAERLVIFGTDGDDTLIVDFSGGSPVPPGGLLFDGGAQVTARGDEVALAGGPFERVGHTAFNGHDGMIDVDGATIEYRGLEPVDLGGPVADLTLDLSGLADFGILESTANSGESRLRTAFFTAEAQTFKNPTNSLTVGLGPNDDILLVDMVSGSGVGQFNAGLILDGESGFDSVSIGVPVDLSGGSALLSITAEDIRLRNNVTTTGSQSYNGPVALNAHVTLSAGGAITMPDVVSGFALSKGGTGTMTLSAANTYDGGTVVNAGVLLVNNATGSGTGSGPVSVASDATLGGTGTIAGAVTLQSDGALAPGASIGTLTALSGVTWNGSASGLSTAKFELSNVDSTSDLLAVTGSFAKGSGPTFGFDFQGTGHSTVYTLATFTTTTFAESDFTYTNLGAGLAGAFSIASGNTLLFTVFPAPTNTPTATPTATPTNTPAPEGGACITTAECARPLVCVDRICTRAASPAPAMSRTGLLIAVGLLMGVAALTLLRRRMM